jgi:hypothetical protein
MQRQSPAAGRHDLSGLLEELVSSKDSVVGHHV